MGIFALQEGSGQALCDGGGENGQLPTLKVETSLDRDGQTNLFSLEHPGL